jgi:citrate lyase subunit beta/citryl-CoA lyase
MRSLGTDRSLLFVPGTRPDRFDKALASGADRVILDLEDAVAPDDKAAARAAIVCWLKPEHAVLLRINGATTPWFMEDLAIARLCGIAAILLPKAESAAEIAAVGQSAPVIPIIETARGFTARQEVAGAPGVCRLAFGSIDFMADLGIPEDVPGVLDSVRFALVLASRLAGLVPPIDGVTQAFEEAATAEAVLRARAFGFGGKLCIHPRQVAAVNAGFAPSPDEVDFARRVVARAAQEAVFALDGRMVDAPVILQARQTLARAARD